VIGDGRVVVAAVDPRRPPAARAVTLVGARLPESPSQLGRVGNLAKSFEAS